MRVHTKQIDMKCYNEQFGIPDDAKLPQTHQGHGTGPTCRIKVTKIVPSTCKRQSGGAGEEFSCTATIAHKLPLVMG